MPDQAGRFSILCARCRMPLMTVPLICEAEVRLLEAHLRSCRASDPLPPAPVMLGEIMRRLRVAAAIQA